jgi:hypothetical protein
MRSLRFFPTFPTSLLLPSLVALLPIGCVSTDDNEEPSNIIVVTEAGAEIEETLALNDQTKLVRQTSESVNTYFELRIQGRTQAAKALRSTIAARVDEDYATFEDMALEGDLLLKRNIAVACLGFASENRVQARTALLRIAENNSEMAFLRANAIRAVGILLDPETPLAPVITLLGARDKQLQTEAAGTFKELARVKKTPKVLTPQYHVAIERLAAMLYVKSNQNGRVHAVWALANLRHPATFDHLVAALGDRYEEVQIGALYGLTLLGDQRAIEPLLSFLGDGQTTTAESWCVKALKAIVVQAGLATDRSELIPLGTSPRKWREYIRAARSD